MRVLHAFCLSEMTCLNRLLRKGSPAGPYSGGPSIVLRLPGGAAADGRSCRRSRRCSPFFEDRNKAVRKNFLHAWCQTRFLWGWALCQSDFGWSQSCLLADGFPGKDGFRAHARLQAGLSIILYRDPACL